MEKVKVVVTGSFSNGGTHEQAFHVIQEVTQDDLVKGYKQSEAIRLANGMRHKNDMKLNEFVKKNDVILTAYSAAAMSDDEILTQSAKLLGITVEVLKAMKQAAVDPSAGQ